MKAASNVTPVATCRASSGSAGFSLVEVLLAIVITSVGILGASGVVLGIASLGRRTSWYTDHTVVGRSGVDSLMHAGFTSVVSGSGVVEVGGRACDLSFEVTPLSPRLKHLRLTATLPNAPESVLESIVSRPRPLPTAP
ncbi:type IV pilus modification PilV family protein [Candidatus Palauibacter sp.]|uniref:type IV pilus modification PilV family protein n=1 Tax=Candidatus Palauibacter sp. TaxID=3101350 RepID=UPI003B521D21